MSENISTARFAVVDTETTGLSPDTCAILQLGIVIISGDGVIEDQFSTYIKRRFWKPGRLGAHHIHGITRWNLHAGVSLPDALDRLSTALSTATFVAHNAPFDLGFLRTEATRCGHSLTITSPICTLALSRSLDPAKTHPHNLRELASRYAITDVPNHDALADALVTARLLPLLLVKANITTVDQLTAIALE